MPKTSDINVLRDHWSYLVVGEHGTGKSIFASSFPTPALLLDFDGGRLSYKDADFYFEGFEGCTQEDWFRYELVFGQIEKDLMYEGEKLQTIVVDSTTAMTTCIMAHAMAKNPQRNKTGGPVWEVHYPQVRNIMEGHLLRLKALSKRGVNVVILTHIKTTKDDVTGQIHMYPALTGALSEIAPGLFDEVYFASTKQEAGKLVWRLQTVNFGYYKGSSRLSGKSRVLPDYMENDYNALLTHLKRGENMKKT